MVDSGKITCTFTFPTFEEAMNFVNHVAHVAETVNHHPDIHIAYNTVTLEMWTHSVNGLSEKDFTLASKIEMLL